MYTNKGPQGLLFTQLVQCKTKEVKAVSTYCLYRSFPVMMLLLSLGATPLMAQPNNSLPSLVQFHFLHDSVSVEENNYSFNNVSISNNSNRSIHVQLVITAPEIASVITGNIIETEIRQGENQAIPIRFILAKNTPALVWRPFNVEIRVKELNQV